VSHTTLISTDELGAHLRGARPTEGPWVIVDCRFDLKDGAWGREEYLAAHIPGAVYADLNVDLAAERTGINGRHPLPTAAALAAAFGRLGLSRDLQVIVYDQDSGLYASRFWWSLRYLGHDQVALLDGGWAKWTAEGRPTQSGDDQRPAAVFDASVRPDYTVYAGDVQSRIGDPATLLIDARGPERFEGREETIDRVAGHIPGATNHFYKWNLSTEGTMLPAEQLRARFASLLGEHAPEQAVMYCGSGVSACHNLLAMEHAGLRGTPLYVGSWSEWSSDPDRPIETGPARGGGPKPPS
jgi:thiosulfate/3-mercaptopyruvate sulfurtransferase